MALRHARRNRIPGPLTGGAVTPEWLPLKGSYFPNTQDNNNILTGGGAAGMALDENGILGAGGTIDGSIITDGSWEAANLWAPAAAFETSVGLPAGTLTTPVPNRMLFFSISVVDWADPPGLGARGGPQISGDSLMNSMGFGLSRKSTGVFNGYGASKVSEDDWNGFGPTGAGDAVIMGLLPVTATGGVWVRGAFTSPVRGNWSTGLPACQSDFYLRVVGWSLATYDPVVCVDIGSQYAPGGLIDFGAGFQLKYAILDVPEIYLPLTEAV